MQRQQGRPGHAVLQARPGSAADRCGTGRESSVERNNTASVGENLLPTELDVRNATSHGRSVCGRPPSAATA